MWVPIIIGIANRGPQLFVYMPKILIHCLVMGKSVDTGLSTDTVVFRSLEGFTFELKCPGCGTVHKWTTAKAWIERENLFR
jgi:hypothetical protein